MKIVNLFIGDMVVGMLEASVPSTALGLGSSTIVGATSTWTTVASDASNDAYATTFATPFGFLSSIGTTVATEALGEYDTNVIQQLNTTQAYMESLDYEELEDMITKLETKEAELSLENTKPKENIKNKRV